MMFTKADRIVGALRGAFVADAASMGTHWIYNPVEMAAAVASIATPEFTNPPTPRFYSAMEFPGHYGPGQLSPYGEQLLFVTEYVAEHDDVDGPTMSTSLVAWAKTFGGRHDHALTTVLSNIDEAGKVWPECGADDSQGKVHLPGVLLGLDGLAGWPGKLWQMHSHHPFCSCCMSYAFKLVACRYA